MGSRPDYHYTLQVEFDTDRDDLLYEGVSFYRKNLIDRVSITNHRIRIIFERKSRIDIQEYMYSSQSPVRIQLYRAVCFYLAVTGTLPSVKSISLISEEQEILLEKERLTRHWDHCDIAMTLSPSDAGKCFGENGKSCYIAITYFLKAQLDVFPHDCFRASWSGINAIYAHLGPEDDSREREKLDALRLLILNQPMKESSKYIKGLSDSFWHEINWGLFIKAGKWNNKNRVVEDMYNNQYQDA